MPTARSLEGVISYLTKRHGDLHENKIVIVTSRSIYSNDPRYARKNVLDLTRDSSFGSKYEPDQWICWDFRERRVSPIQYTIWTQSLKSWVLEGSVNGVDWVEIDQHTDEQMFKSAQKASFPVAARVECRYIRLTQTGKNHNNGNFLSLRGVEFFGTLFE
jgi:hypothetical protein